MDKYFILGNKWTSLAAYFEGRSGNEVRNRCLMILRYREKRTFLISSDPKVRPPAAEKSPHPVANMFLPHARGTVWDFGTDDLLSLFFSGLETGDSST
jgi:hypothetical protein